MYNMLISSFKLSNTYYTNTLIYRLKHLPLIGKLIPRDFYGNPGLKTMANIISFLLKIGMAISGKILYVLLFLVFPLTILKDNQGIYFFQILFFMSLIGAFLNTEMFNPTKEKYYSVVLMRTDANLYATSSYLWFLLKNALLLLPILILCGLFYKQSILLCILFPFLIAAMKSIGAYILLKYFEKTGKVVNENNFTLAGTVIVIGLLLGFGLPFLGIVISPILLISIVTVIVLLSIYAFHYLLKTHSYKKLYKKMVTINTVIFNTMEASQKAQKSNYITSLESGKVDVGSRKGYAYFNEIFMQRHKKILTKSAHKFALVYVVILAIAVLFVIFDSETSTNINKLLLTFLPYFVFIMYLTNRGSVITQAMFINCDNSMLSYRFYRQPKVILQLFKERLVTLIKINMAPTLVIALGLPLLLFLTGGSNPLYYILLFVSIMSMSIFFSVHHLILYYLLQPYDIQMKAKSSMYSIINGLTYFVCYMCIRLQAPTLIFASLVTIFCIAYVGVSLYLVYKYAPKTFHLKH